MTFRLVPLFALVGLLGAASPERPSGSYFPPAFAERTLRCDYPGHTIMEATVSDGEADWYSGHLSAAGEPALYSTEPRPREAGQAIRFIWLPSFHAPVFVRVNGLGTAAPGLIAKRLSGLGGYEAGGIADEVARPLTTAEAAGLAALLARTDVTRLPARDCAGGLDGAQWLIESVDADGYRFVSRWSPESGAVREVGLAMLALTKWHFPDVY